MTLNNYTPPQVTIQTACGPLIFRGLTPDDMSTLVFKHGGIIETWFEGEVNLMQSLNRAPAVMADVIAMAAGQPESAPQAALLPIGLQVRACSEIIKLTFGELDMTGPVGDFVAAFTKGGKS